MSAKLAATLGAETATFKQLFRAIVSNDDAAVCADALEVWLKSLEAAPELSNRVLTSVSMLDAGSLPELLRNQAGPHAEEIVEYVARHASGSALRLKASSLLQQMRHQASPRVQTFPRR